MARENNKRSKVPPATFRKNRATANTPLKVNLSTLTEKINFLKWRTPASDYEGGQDLAIQTYHNEILYSSPNKPETYTPAWHITTGGYTIEVGGADKNTDEEGEDNDVKLKGKKAMAQTATTTIISLTIIILLSLFYFQVREIKSPTKVNITETEDQEGKNVKNFLTNIRR